MLLDLPLDVVAMQVNAAFQIGAIRARPASLTVAIEIPALTATAALPLKTGFHLGPIDLDATGCISIVRLIPTSQPFRPVQTRSAFEIDGVTVVPANERERLQLMSTAGFTHDDAVICSARANFSRVGSEFGNQATSPALPRQRGARFIEFAKLPCAERRKFRSDEGAARPIAPNRRAHPDTDRLTTHRSTAILAVGPTGTLPVALTPAMKPHGPNNFQSTNREMSS